MSSKWWLKMTLSERKSFSKTLKRLQQGSSVKLKHPLFHLTEKNANSAIKHGKFITDNIAAWLKAGFVKGPFDQIPLTNFRINPLMAAVQKDKVRPILNLSAPKDRSFNDAIDTFSLKKLTMSSAKKFSFSLKKAGKNALMSKYDLSDAYKNIPSDPNQWNLYGFQWLGKFFFECTTVFGSKAAPETFDCLPETLVNLVCLSGKIPKIWIHRQLDDVPIVSPAHSNYTKIFSKKYEKLCKFLNIPLAPLCPNHEKSFRNSTFGTVLGFIFNSKTMQWSISKEKAHKLIFQINRFQLQKTCKLKELQKIMGKLNDISQMFDFSKAFRFHLLHFLLKFQDNDLVSKIIPNRVKEDLNIWKRFIWAAEKGLPISDPPSLPPFSSIICISDAAGASFSPFNSKRHIGLSSEKGAASFVYFNSEPKFFITIRWPCNFFNKSDKDHKSFGSKTTFLELIGLLLPLLSNPSYFSNKNVVFLVDNIAVVYGWEKRYCKNDEYSSILLRTLQLLEATIEAKFFVLHEKRMSTQRAILADHFSRNSSITPTDELFVKNLKQFKPNSVILNWLKNPICDWTIPEKTMFEINAKLYTRFNFWPGP